jgi:hypothetical protein
VIVGVCACIVGLAIASFTNWAAFPRNDDSINGCRCVHWPTTGGEALTARPWVGLGALGVLVSAIAAGLVARQAWLCRPDLRRIVATTIWTIATAVLLIDAILLLAYFSGLDHALNGSD